jgi:Tol biopolymer transport system component
MTTRKPLIMPCIAVLIIFLVFTSISSAFKYDPSKVKIQTVTTTGENWQPEWSPDGSSIVYASTERDQNSCIWITDSAGTNRRMISKLDYEYKHSEPTWSPDGTQIAFIASRDPHEFYIYKMDSDGSNAAQITPRIDDQMIFNLNWCPEGSKIMYDSQPITSKDYRIMVINSDGSNVMKLTETGDAYNSIWSQDGSKIAFERAVPEGTEIWSMDPDGSNKRQLMPQEKYAEYNYTQPTWNPDGSKIAFVTNRYSDYKDLDIVVFDLKDNSITTLTLTRPRYYQPYMVGYEHFYDPELVVEGHTRGDEFSPKWNSDGRKLVFCSEYDAGIWLMNSDGSDKVLLVASEYPGELIFNPQWSPDGSKILFERKYLGSWNICVITLGEAIISVPTPSPSPTISVPPEPTSTITPTLPVSPTITPTPALTAPVTEFPPEEGKPSAEYPQTATTTPTPEEPGFDAVFAIAGLLAVTYLVLKSRR